MISVLILTRNEQHDLPAALASVAWCDDIHVLDSCSTDDTAAIARRAGASVHTRPFDDYATQRNHGLRLPFRHAWVFLLDADERATPQLSDEMRRTILALQATGNRDRVGGYRLRRRDFLFGTWLRHAQISPFYIRLVRPDCAQYNRAINEVLQIAGPIEGPAGGNIRDLEHPVDHFPFNKGIAHWVAKHNVYSTMEAELIHREEGLQDPSLRTALLDDDFHTRRRHQKAIFYRLRARPILKWAYMMCYRGAILDGSAGFVYATLQAFYEYLIVLKTAELRRTDPRPAPRPVPETPSIAQAQIPAEATTGQQG